MRYVMLLVYMILAVSSVQAVGVATSSDINDGFDLDLGDEVDIEFFVRGDENVLNEVEFFIYSDTDGLEFDNQEDYRDSMDLEQYENVRIVLTMEANEAGTHEVTWGIISKDNGGGLPIEQVIEKSFIVEVDGESNNDDNGDDDDDDDNGEDGGSVNLNVPSSGSGSGSGGGGGSGGGAVPRLDPTIDDAEVNPSEPSIQDVSAQGTATSEMVVDTGEKSKGLLAPLGNQLEIGRIATGMTAKTVALAMLALAFVGMMSSMISIKMYKGVRQ